MLDAQHTVLGGDKDEEKIFLVLLMTITFGIFADEYELQNVPIDYIGTYIPVEMEKYLKEYMAYEKALQKCHKSNYDILILKDNICYSQERFGDGYAVKSENFERWSFNTKENEKYIIDENKKVYRRITDNNDECYEIYARVVLSILFSDAMHNKNIKVEGSKITIYGEEYEFDISPFYIADDEVLYMSGRILKIDGVSANLYGTESTGKWTVKRTDEIIQTVPLFYWDDSNYPEIDLEKYKTSKKDLKLLRNLVYAKHGYHFKSEELNNIFSEFDWYAVNLNFSEDDFSSKEKKLLKRIKKYESKLK